MSNESPFSLTIKSDEGYDAAMLTVRGDTKTELAERLDQVNDDLLQKIVDTKALFKAVVIATQGLSANAGQSQGQDATVTPITGGTGLKTCEHGVRVRRDGTNSKGKWTGYFCALPKGSQGACDPIWE